METHCGKYTPLFRHLTGFDGERWPATFKAVETILGFPLPKSARTYPAWWANDESGTHRHARAWQAAGWRTSRVDLAAETLVFECAELGISTAAKCGRGGQQPASVRRKYGPASSMKEVVHAAGTLTLDSQMFQHAACISPEAGPDGKPLEDMPQRRCSAAASMPLNRHGHGPFCRFSVARLPAASGVYAVTVAQKLVYVGIATDLKRRWGPSGYAQIQPRNCFKGGQSTNCKVNHAILLAARDGLAIHLWIRQTETPRPFEARLIAELAPPWNDQR